MYCMRVNLILCLHVVPHDQAIPQGRKSKIDDSDPGRNTASLSKIVLTVKSPIYQSVRVGSKPSINASQDTQTMFDSPYSSNFFSLSSFLPITQAGHVRGSDGNLRYTACKDGECQSLRNIQLPVSESNVE
jgi:hypothetical protein